MKILYKISMTLLLLLVQLASSQDFGRRSIVGVIAIPSDVPGYDPETYTYIPAAYVGFLQSAGAQVVPIRYDLPRDQIVKLLSKVNGVLYTGGNSVFLDDKGKMTRVAESLEFITNYALDQNLNGNYYPIWGTCQGFQAIAMILGRNYSILTHCTGCIDVSRNNILEKNYQSKLFSNMPDDLTAKLATANLSRYVENWKLDIVSFYENPYLSTYLVPTSYTTDAAGVDYISSFESPYLPIYAIQFHQEASTYGWGGKTTNHNEDAVRLQQHLSNFFVNETRKNNNVFVDHEDYIIENYKITMVANTTLSPTYFFPALNQNIQEPAHSHHNFRGLEI